MLLVDDSIVRGTTSKEIVQMAREAGARKGVHGQRRAAGALPQRLRHRHADARGTDRHGRSIEEIRAFIGADALIYQDVAAMKRVISALNPSVQGFEASCFDGEYVTGDISAADFDAMANQRKAQGDDEGTRNGGRLALQGRRSRPRDGARARTSRGLHRGHARRAVPRWNAAPRRKLRGAVPEHRL